MPDKAPCPRCRKTGFVRFETVLKGGTSHRACYCGTCNHSWDVAEDGAQASRTNTGDRPDRSRSR